MKNNNGTNIFNSYLPENSYENVGSSATQSGITHLSDLSKSSVENTSSKSN